MRGFVVVALAVGMVACDKPPAGDGTDRAAGEPTPAPDEPPPAPGEPAQGERPEPVLDTALARLAPRERSALFVRCPPADEAAEAAIAALNTSAATCRAARKEPAACRDFVTRVESAVLDSAGCVYAPTPSPDEVRRPGQAEPAYDRALALHAAVAEAKARALAGDVDGAARLVGRVVRAAVTLARGDGDVAWATLRDLEDWGQLLDGWAGRVSEKAAGLVRMDLEAAKAAFLELDFVLRACLVRDVERGQVLGGFQGPIYAEAALATLAALLDGSDLATQDAEIRALMEANSGIMDRLDEEFGPRVSERPPRELTPKEHALFVLVARRLVIDGIKPVAEGHARASAALERLMHW